MTDDLWAHCIHDITHQGDTGCDGNRLIYERQVIADGVLSRRFTRLFHSNHVVTALCKAHEERDKERHKHYPFAQFYMGSQSAGKQTKHKTKGNDTHINNGMLLQPSAISQI